MQVRPTPVVPPVVPVFPPLVPVFPPVVPVMDGKLRSGSEKVAVAHQLSTFALPVAHSPHDLQSNSLPSLDW
jgi:hypothetical protein